MSRTDSGAIEADRDRQGDRQGERQGDRETVR